MIKTVKVFNGKRYRRHDSYVSKLKATQTAKHFRINKMPSRIIKDKDGRWAVYVKQ